jgi:hypothetical protein
MKAAAENLTSVLLELGGQNPALVDETAHIADAAKKIVWGAMAWGGQWCTSPGYAYVHESVSDAFVAEAKKAVVDLYGPDPRTNPDYSRVISAREVSRLAGLIDPAKVVAGGRSDPDRAPPVSCVATRSSSSGSRACGRDAAPRVSGKGGRSRDSMRRSRCGGRFVTGLLTKGVRPPSTGREATHCRRTYFVGTNIQATTVRKAAQLAT